MRQKKIFIPIILSIIIGILNIYLYLKMRNTINLPVENSYEMASILFSSFIQFGTLIYGVILILQIWLEYLLILLLMKVYKNFTGLKKVLLSLCLLILILLILIYSIYIIMFMVTIL